MMVLLKTSTVRTSPDASRCGIAKDPPLPDTICSIRSLIRYAGSWLMSDIGHHAELLFRVPVIPYGGGVGLQDQAGGGFDQELHGRVLLEDLTVALFAFAQRLFALFPAGDVLLDPDVIGYIAPLVPQGRYGCRFPVELAVLFLVLHLAPEFPSGSKSFPHVPVKCGLMMSRLQDPGVPADQFRYSVTRKFFKGRIDILDGPVAIGDDHGRGALVNRKGKLGQMLLGVAQLGDVPVHRKDALPAGHLDDPARAQHDQFAAGPGAVAELGIDEAALGPKLGKHGLPVFRTGPYAQLPGGPADDLATGVAGHAQERIVHFQIFSGLEHAQRDPIRHQVECIKTVNGQVHLGCFCNRKGC